MLSIPPTRPRLPGFAVFTALLAMTTACVSPGGVGQVAGSRDAGESCPAPYWDIPERLDRDVDLLFVIDNSGSMADEQAMLKAQFSSLMQKLRSMAGGLPNLHLGVTSSDLGTSPFAISFCEEAGGDSGRLLIGSCVNPAGAAYVVDVEPAHCEITKDASGICSFDDCQPSSCAHEPSTSVVIDPATGCPRCRNYSGEQLEDVFTCIAGLGTQGCGFEQPLEAMFKALEPANTANQGFIRERALLGVVFITDEDDCSASNFQIFDNSQTDLDSLLGPLSSFRCFEFGIQCDQNGRTEQGLRTSCVPREDEGALLHPVSRYIEFLKWVKDPQRLVVAAIAGPVTNQQVFVGLDLFDQPEVKPSCTTERGGAVPGIRMKAVIEALNDVEDLSWAYSSVCSPTYTDALQGIAGKITRVMGLRCNPRPFQGCSDPGAQFGRPADSYPGNDQCLPVCQVTSTYERGTDDETCTLVPPCLEVCPQGPCPGNTDPAQAFAQGHPPLLDASMPVDACWQIGYQELCASSRYGEVLVSRRVEPPARTFTYVDCVMIPPAEVFCTDGKDDDEDGLVDTDDPDCLQ